MIKRPPSRVRKTSKFLPPCYGRRKKAPYNVITRPNILARRNPHNNKKGGRFQRLRGQHAKSAWGKTISCTELLPPPQAGVFELFSHFEARIFGQRSPHPERFWHTARASPPPVRPPPHSPKGRRACNDHGACVCVCVSVSVCVWMNDVL